MTTTTHRRRSPAAPAPRLTWTWLLVGFLGGATLALHVSPQLVIAGALGVLVLAGLVTATGGRR
jgi:hypothetical protein